MWLYGLVKTDADDVLLTANSLLEPALTTDDGGSSALPLDSELYRPASQDETRQSGITDADRCPYLNSLNIRYDIIYKNLRCAQKLTELSVIYENKMLSYRRETALQGAL